MQVPYSDLSNVHILAGGIGSAKWKKKDVTLLTSLTDLNLYDQKRFISESTALYSHSHPHMVRLVGISISTTQIMALYDYSIKKHVTLAEFMQTNRNNSNILMPQRIRTCLQVARAVAHLHGLGIVHGSLHSQPVILDKILYEARLAPFSMDRYSTIPKCLSLSHLKYMEEQQPLQQQEEQQKANQSQDIYSLGCLMLAILSNREPFETIQSLKEWEDLVKQKKTTAILMNTLSSINHIPKALISLVSKCWDPNPEERPLIQLCVNILQSPADSLLEITTKRTATENGESKLISKTNQKESASPLTLLSGAPSPPAPLSIANNNIVDQKTMDSINAVQASLRAMNPVFGDGPSVEHCDVARETAFRKLGVIDQRMLIGEHLSTCALYIIHRPLHQTVALATRGLSDPPSDEPGTTGLGLELWAEAKQSEIGDGLAQSFLFQIIHEVAANARNFGLKLRNLINIHGLVSMELNHVDAPPLYIDPVTKRTCVLLGVPSPTLPDHFMMPYNLKVKIVTVRLLTFQECLVIRRYGAAGRKALTDLFQRDGTHHVSTISHIEAAPSAAMMMSQSQSAGGQAQPTTPLVPAARGVATVATTTIATAPTVPASGGGVNGCDSGKVTVDAKTSIDVDAVQKELAKLKLPPIDDEKETVNANPVFVRFADRTPLTKALSILDKRVRDLMNQSNNTSHNLARHVSNALSTQTQLAGWFHVQVSLCFVCFYPCFILTFCFFFMNNGKKEYIVDPKGYQDKLKAVRGPQPRDSPPPIRGGPGRPIDDLQRTGHRLINRMMQRIELVEKKFREEGKAFDPDYCLQLLSTDNKWMEESSTFMRESEQKVTDLLKKNPQRFAAFRDLQRRGVQWPHSPALRREIEAAGFVFRPMMVKRDRCVCEVCGCEVSGWRPWHIPWQMHDLSRHPKAFQDRAKESIDAAKLTIPSSSSSSSTSSSSPTIPMTPITIKPSIAMDLQSSSTPTLPETRLSTATPSATRVHSGSEREGKTSSANSEAHGKLDMATATLPVPTNSLPLESKSDTISTKTHEDSDAPKNKRSVSKTTHTGKRKSPSPERHDHHHPTSDERDSKRKR
jgi:serine/threonine protein kinase